MYLKNHYKKTFLSIHYKKILELKHNLKHLKKENKNNTEDLIKHKIFTNLKRIIHYIDTNYNNKLIHVSNKKLNIKDLHNTNYINKSLFKNKSLVKNRGDIYFNPYGLWLSCGSSWLKWILYTKYYSSQWSNPKYIYEIILNDNNNVLKISNLNELLKFHHKFAQLKDNNYKIDWKEVKKTYDGLIIDPYLGKDIWTFFNNKESIYFYLNNKTNKYIHATLGKNIKRYMQFYLEWYRHWETASGVIWRVKSIKSVNHIL